jgi:aromatic ring-opening dioxygenase catalytic subunit (LigB family)
LPPRKPKAIVVFSAHYKANPMEISSSKPPPMLYDYHGFPPEAYEYEYPAPGCPELAAEIQLLFSSNNIDSVLNESRGFDHGVFIPLMLMYPEHDIPVVCVSLDESLDISAHLKIGSALAPL